MDINDLDFDDEEHLEDSSNSNSGWVDDPYAEDSNSGNSNNQPEIDPLQAYLMDNGISDIHKIKFQEDDGSVVERDWNDLDPEEQYGVIADASRNPRTELDEEEIQLLNGIRSSGMTPSQYFQAWVQRIQQNAANTESATPQPYDFDQFTDEQVYAIDLVSRFPDMTDEEVDSALEQAKANEELFKKQVVNLRDQAKERQQKEINARLAEDQKKDEMYRNAILDNIEGFQSVGSMNVNLQQNDMEDLASFILPQNGNISPFGQALNDPKNVVRAAWFLLKGPEVFDNINQYIASQVREAQQQGYNQALQQMGKNNKVVVQNTPKKEKPLTIDDLD